MVTYLCSDINQRKKRHYCNNTVFILLIFWSESNQRFCSDIFPIRIKSEVLFWFLSDRNKIKTFFVISKIRNRKRNDQNSNFLYKNFKNSRKKSRHKRDFNKIIWSGWFYCVHLLREQVSYNRELNLIWRKKFLWSFFCKKLMLLSQAKQSLKSWKSLRNLKILFLKFWQDYVRNLEDWHKPLKKF